MKKVIAIHSAPEPHWVGDGFPVHGMFSYSSPGVQQRSPFLLLDYAAPTHFEPATHRRGVGPHPHRGFETVTIVYDGEVEHRDSTGNGGVIGAGDVQWMTAGRGILHEEFHSEQYARRGGPFEMVQLWVNLPANCKMTEPGYQAITDDQIPRLQLTEDVGILRVIAGRYEGIEGPASTFTALNVWDLRLDAGKTLQLPQREGWSVQVVALSGAVQINGTALNEKQMVTLSTEGSVVSIETRTAAKLLLLAGEPIDEPVVGYGPFVMNSSEEITQAVLDFSSGSFGRMHS